MIGMTVKGGHHQDKRGGSEVPLRLREGWYGRAPLDPGGVG
jgi:hypothetical protein